LYRSYAFGCPFSLYPQSLPYIFLLLKHLVLNCGKLSAFVERYCIKGMKFLNNNIIKPGAESGVSSEAAGENRHSRRGFLQIAGGVTGAGLLLDACRKGASTSVYMGTGDVSLLNYLYIINQVQAGFYTQAFATAYYDTNGATRLSEYQFLQDLRDHQLAYMGLFQAMLGTSAIEKVQLQLSQVTFADRTSTLSHATTMQDWAAGAYNGAARLFKNTMYIPIIAKIASVEARHAEYVRDALNWGTFGDDTVVDVNGLGQALSPNTVMPFFQTYIQTTFDYSQVPSF